MSSKVPRWSVQLQEILQTAGRKCRLADMANQTAVHAPPAAFPDLWNRPKFLWEIPAFKADIRARKTKRIAFP